MDTNGVTWTSEDVKLVEKFIDIRNRGYYVSGEQLTEVYNRVLNKHVNITNCGACLRGRVNELETALNEFKARLKVQETTNKPELDSIKEDENKAADEAKNEDMKARMSKVRAARKQNK